MSNFPSLMLFCQPFLARKGSLPSGSSVPIHILLALSSGRTSKVSPRWLSDPSVPCISPQLRPWPDRQRIFAHDLGICSTTSQSHPLATIKSISKLRLLSILSQCQATIQSRLDFGGCSAWNGRYKTSPGVSASRLGYIREVTHAEMQVWHGERDIP